MESRYHSLGLEARLLLPEQDKYRSGTVWTAQLPTRSVWFDFPEHCSHCIGSVSKPDWKSIRYSVNIAWGHIHTIPDRLSERSKTIPDSPSVHTWSNWFGTIFVTIMTWNAPIPKVIHSVSHSFLESSAPDVNGLFIGSAPFLKRNLVITSLDSRLCFSAKPN